MRFGGCLFHYRTSIPVPIAIALLLVPAASLPHPLFFDAAGIALVALGELIRLWAVRHIGVISRTRSNRLGPLVSTGPFALVRNPLYLGNIALWTGFGLSAHLPWIAALIVVVLGVEYHAIVRWEETLLEDRRGDEYRSYAARVPRWIPTTNRNARQELGGTVSADSPRAGVFSWRETLYSERGTLIAISAGYLLLWVKSRF